MQGQQKDSDLIAAVEASLLEGLTRSEILKDAGADGIDAADVDRAIAIVVDRWILEASEERDAVLGYHVRTLKHLYEKSHRLSDYKTCLQILKQLAKVQRLETIAKRSPKTAAAPAEAPAPASGVENRKLRALRVLNGRD